MSEAKIRVKKPAKADKATGAMTRALQGVKALIVNGDLSPGEQIRQEEMAEQLQVSRVPLREAMNVLADQGLLFHRPHQGYFVTKRVAGEHAQIRRMLHLLENELMLTIRWPDKAALAELRALNGEMRDCVKQADIRQLIQVNRQFHFRIFSLSPNSLILEEVRRLWSMIEPSMWTKYDRADDRAKTVVEHDRLIAALAAHDRARCAAEMEHHRYSAESGMPIELPGVVPEMPVTN
ncbi:MAG: GntR family transcriptional regulator [Bdellovibrionales bacterium]|nr:GntR family transcriptional regulator [Ramlibacter sp.]